MTKVMKIIGRIIGISLEWILIFLLFFFFFIRTSTVQTYLAQIATDYLSKELKAEIKVEGVSILLFNKMSLNNVLIKDQKRDTLAHIKNIYFKIGKLNLRKNKFTVRAIDIENGTIKVNRDKKTGDFNYWFITDYFSSSNNSTNKSIDVALNELELKNINFYYDDNRKYYSKFGMDYDHLVIKKINLISNNISISGDTISGKIKNLSAIEKCGFVLSDFKTNYKVSPKGILLDHLKIKTPLSVIYAPKMNLLMDRYQCVYSFEDSVSFNSIINTSSVSLKDVSYFATYLEGMEQQVKIKANVTKRVKDLKISNFELLTGKNTKITGTINLPDFRNFKSAFFQEKIDYAFISLNDLKKIRLPKDEGGGFVKLDKYIERLGYFEAHNLKIDGFHSQFVVAANRLKTAIGSVKFDNGIMLTENPVNKSYLFERSQASEYDIKIEKFKLDKFLNDENFGLIDGTVFLSGEAFSIANIKFNDIEGDINHFDYLDYTYKNVFVEDGTFIDNVFDAKIEVKDDNLNLVYDGFIDFNGIQHMVFDVDLSKAILNNLNINHIDNSQLSSNFRIDLVGNSSNTLYGTVKMNGLEYTAGKNHFSIPALTINVDRSPEEDILSIKSDLVNTTFKGKVDFSTVLGDFENQFSKVFPAIIKPKSLLKSNKKSKNKLKKIKTNNHFEYAIEIKEINEFLTVFVPDLVVSKGTKISGNYVSETENFSMKITSTAINYQGIQMEGISVNQKLSSTELTADYKLKKLYLNDSINIDDVHFVSNGKKDSLLSELTWNPLTENNSKISWNTTVLGLDKFSILLNPSFFALKQKRWDIKNDATIDIQGNNIFVQNFLLEREKQYIEINGKISTNDDDKLNFKVNDLNLDDLSSLLGSTVKLKGLVNGWGYISNPYENLNYIGDANIQDLIIDNHEVGNIFVQSQWNRINNSFGLTGNLIYKNVNTFAFEGNYFVNRTDNNLDFLLNFDHTDLKFTNAFMDPEVMNNISGSLNGKIKVSGTLDEPILNGMVNLENGNTQIDILGLNFGISGKIKADKYGFYIDYMPVQDQEGNTGSVSGSIYHSNFTNWNFDLAFNLEDDYYNKDPFLKWKPAPLEKFLITNTNYKDGDVYFGKGYATGTANIFGFADNLEVTVNLKTQKDTKIFFPMYGSEEIEDDESFIKFTHKLDSSRNQLPKIDFTGVSLDLNFEVTPDAQLKVLFSDKTGDELFATGNGSIAVTLNNLGDVEMEGTFNVKKGNYNFVMGSINKSLTIQQGSITWTGDPYNAYVDLQSYFEVKTNLADISPDKISGATSTGNQNVQCFINLSESLFKPAITFDIKAPNVTGEGQNLLSRIRTDKDELNRQFFSLLLWQKFQPLQGSTSANGSAALDLVSNQLNTMLSQVSKDYKIKVNLENKQIGVTKQIGNKIIITSTISASNTTTSNSSSSSSGTTSTLPASTTTNQNAFMGDINIEYLLNESGSVRFNIFNQSNDNTVIQEKQLGLFTQGAGFHYQEDFNSVEDFKLIQYILDPFRKTKKFPNKRRKNQTPIPN